MLFSQPQEKLWVEREIAALRNLHPTYTDAQLKECRDNFVQYLDFVWKVYERMRLDGRLEQLLTEADFNPTVNPLSPPDINPPAP